VVPGTKPVTTPPDVIDATDGLVLLHVPLLTELVKLVDEATHILKLPLITPGVGFTVMALVFVVEHPGMVAVAVYVRVVRVEIVVGFA
jgi:hypothetical protein